MSTSATLDRCKRRPWLGVLAELAARQQRGASAGQGPRRGRPLGVGERTVWRWIATGRPPQRHRSSPHRLVLTPELRDAYLRLGGTVAAVWRDARERGFVPPPLRTLQAAFARELSPAERAWQSAGSRAGASMACTCVTRRRIVIRSCMRL